ncbi:MAG: glycosyltransferase family 2 protein [Flavobacteriales bacterium]|nr:glycosyltransferase family 2 protein [Flavobacteriales bacterium]
MVKVAVVILNYNGATYLKQFLPSVQHTKNAEIWVADNASTDDSIAFLKETFPQVRVVEMAKNNGYAGGYNEALKQIEAEYFVLLNSDVEVTHNWIEPIIQLMDNDKSVAACQPKIKSYNDKTSFEYAGAAGGFIDKYGYPFCRGRIFDTLEKDEGQYDDAIEVFWATGACLFVRSKAYNEVGGLDADYFAHMEEIDLCWRLKNAGYKIMCEPKSVVYHVGGATLKKSNPYKTYLNFRNSLFTIVKNHPRNGMFYVILIRLLLDGVAGVKFLLNGEIKNTLAIIKAHFSFYGAFNSMMKKRKKHSRLPSKIYQFSIVYQYYFRGIKKYSELFVT